MSKELERTPPVCCLCGQRYRSRDWMEWQLEKGGRYFRCHETCVYALIARTVRERETGQRELFGDNVTTPLET